MFSWTLTPQSPHGRPRWAEVVVAVAALALVAGGVYLLSRTHQRSHSTTATARPARPTVRRTVPPRRVAPGEVDLSGVSWRDFHGVQLPYSHANGPAEVGGNRAWGFADSAGGAVFAAVHIGVRANAQWGPDIFEPTIRYQVDGPDKAVLLDQLGLAYQQLADKAGVSGGGPVGRAYAVEEGFRVESFSRDAATVDVVTAGPGSDGTTVRTATRIQLVWHDQDWRVLAPPGGDWGSSAHLVGSLDGYQRFGNEQGGS